MKNKFVKPNSNIIPMAPFARKNLIQAGFLAGLHFCDLDQHDLRENDPEKFNDMCKALMDVFESYGLTREIEF